MKNLIFPIIFGGVGLIMLIVTFFIITSEEEFMKNAQVTEGKVVQLILRKSHTHSQDAGSYYPVVEFSYNGQTTAFQSTVGSSPASYTVGETVQVYFDPSDLKSAQIKSFFSQWFLSCMIGGMGFLFFSIGVIIAFFTIRKNRKENIIQN